MTDQKLPRLRAISALKSLFIGDALAMPVHWYYNIMDIERQFPGGITDFEDAPAFHPSSIMSLHSTSKGGRSGQRGHLQKSEPREIVGDVILKGKRAFWGQANQHYHQGMVAGQNTLNAYCVRSLMRTLTANKGSYDKEQFLDAYIELMTAEQALHPDTYAESYHRGFFANLEAGKPRDQCGAVTHDTASIGGLVTIAPLVIAERLAGTPIEEVQQLCRIHLMLTHPDESLATVCGGYVTLIDSLLFRDPDQSTAEILEDTARKSVSFDLRKLLNKSISDRHVIGRVFSPACYISDSWPGVLYLAYKYRESLMKGLIANTNLGGDNVHRGAVLGVILSLMNEGSEVEQFAKLCDASSIQGEIELLIGSAVSS
jgi:ADP-ribosylglycohydrolase